MCTVSFIPTARGFYVAMNRDELRTRDLGLSPRALLREGCRVVYPTEPSGGTWISVNEKGVCLALVNWHRVKTVPDGELISRGEVVRALATAGTLSEIDEKLRSLALARMRPFRLMAMAGGESRVREYRWDLKKISIRRYKWTRRHWFSSGYDEEKAARARRQVFGQAWLRDDAGSLKWLRELHASHLPKRGPFSICMHQTVAETVSYTEVVLEDRDIAMRYRAGSPCEPGEVYEVIVQRSACFAE